MSCITRIVLSLSMAIGCGSGLFGPGAAAPALLPHSPITMQQAVEQVLAHNPVLLAAQQNLLSMKGQEVQAGVRANPYLDWNWHGRLPSGQQSQQSVLLFHRGKQAV